MQKEQPVHSEYEYEQRKKDLSHQPNLKLSGGLEKLKVGWLMAKGIDSTV